MKTLNNVLILVFFTGLLLSFSSCENKESKQIKNTTVANKKIQKVEVVASIQRSFTAELLITGTAGPNQITTLYAMESGMLTQLHKDIGDKVRTGDILAVLENPELLQQQLKWQVETKIKRTTYDRLNKVYERTPALTSVQVLEDAEAEFLSASANLDAVNNHISFLVVKAPFSGIITKRFVDKGALIQSGLSQSDPQAIFEVQQSDPIRLSIPVPGSDVRGIKIGMPVEVTFPEVSGVPISAKVSRMSNVLDPMSKTMHVEIDMKNSEGKIISGMYAKVLLQTSSRDNILSLPIMAKVSHKNEEYVLAVEDGMVKRVPIKIGLSNQEYFEVLNNEIDSQTLVIVQGKSLVKPGQIVEAILKNEQ